jgi:mono/diheme cytochrome c family protein
MFARWNATRVLGGVLTAILVASAAGPGVAQSPNGKMKNPYKADDAAVVKEGRTLWLQYGCSGCHGVGGGGGMGPPVIDDVWKFGSDDETLYKLIKGQNPQSTMPRVFTSMPDEEAWKILTYIRSIYAGDPKKINW